MTNFNHPVSSLSDEYDDDIGPDMENTHIYDYAAYNAHYGGNLEGKYDAFRQHLMDIGFTWLSYGSFRSVYVRGKVAIKVPRNGDGIIDNRVEAQAWRTYKNKPTNRDIMLAPCRLLPNGCLMMVAVSGLPDNVDYPSWVDTVDAGQVGLHKGKVVAYDYACDMDERDNWEHDWKVESDFYRSNW